MTEYNVKELEQRLEEVLDHYIENNLEKVLKSRPSMYDEQFVAVFNYALKHKATNNKYPSDLTDHWKGLTVQLGLSKCSDIQNFYSLLQKGKWEEESQRATIDGRLLIARTEYIGAGILSVNGVDGVFTPNKANNIMKNQFYVSPDIASLTIKVVLSSKKNDKKKLPALQPLKSISHNQPDNGCSKSNRSKSARDLESNKPSRPSHSRSNSVGDGARRRNKATFHANNASLFDMSGLSDLEKDEGNVHRNWLTDLASQVTTKALEGASRSMLDFQGNQHRRRVNLHKSLLEASMHGHDEDDDDDETEAVDFETNILNLDDDEEPNNPEFPRADSPKHGPFKQSVSPIGTSYISSPSSNEGELPSPSKGAATLLKSPPCADQQPTTNVDCVTKEDTTNTSAKDSTVSESLYCAFETTLDLGADKDLQSVGLTLVPNGLLKSPSIFDLGQHHTQYDDATAVGIAQVEPGSDAEKAGLCPFDFIYTQSAVSDCAQAHKLLVLRLKSTVSDTKMPASTTTTTVQSEITGEAPAESNVLEYDSMGKDDGSKGKTDAWKDHDPLSSNWLDGSGDASLTMHNGSGSDLLEGLEQLWEQGLHLPESNEATVEVVPPPASRTGKTLQTLETLSNQMEPTNEPSEETIAVSMTGTKLSDNESNRGSEDNSFNEAKPPPKPSKTVKKSKARPSAGSVPPTLRRSRRQLDLDAEVEAVSNPDEIGRRGRGGHRI